MEPRHIVVGVDATGLCDQAVLAAFELARRFDGEVHLVHAVEGLSGGFVTGLEDNFVPAATDAVLARLRGLPAEGRPSDEELSGRLKVKPGQPARLLLEMARKQDAALIVLGPHEKRGIVDFGSTARAVLAHAHCPVWMQSGDWRPIKRILVPVDLSRESLSALERARTWARAFGAELLVLHVFPPPVFAYPVPDAPEYMVDKQREEDRESLRTTLADFDWDGVKHEVQVVEGDPAAAILQHEQRADLVVMGTHGRTGLAAAVLGSVAYQVMKSAAIPVLAARMTDRSFLES